MSKRNQTGASAAEFLLLVALIAVIAYGFITLQKGDSTTTKTTTTTTTAVATSVTTVSSTTSTLPPASIVPNNTEGCATRQPDGSWKEHGCLEQPEAGGS